MGHCIMFVAFPNTHTHITCMHKFCKFFAVPDGKGHHYTTNAICRLEVDIVFAYTPYTQHYNTKICAMQPIKIVAIV